MKRFVIFFKIMALTAITSCGQGNVNNKVSEINSIESNSVKIKETEIQQTHHFDTIFIANKQTFKFEIKDISEEEVTLTFTRNSENIKVHTLQSGGLGNVEFVDFNKDENIDILFSYMGNNPSYVIYLFDKSSNEFKNLKGYDRFPEAIQLKTNPKYYYSYHRAGCADLNWVSDLFYIDNFKTIHIGQIYGYGCEKENPQIIEVYKVFEDNDEYKKEIEKLPYLKNIPDFGDKWDFIEKYWNKNYKKFNRN